MKEQTIFQGVATAIVTPMNENGVDYDAFGKLIDWQIEQGINGLVVAGTTGEGSTLSDEEHREVLAYAVKKSMDVYHVLPEPAPMIQPMRLN